ncbi:alpha/beta hydrolase [Lysobacteraceae bacterium NML93-0792]|nr:alpha/beta hydrolase [Xanthomonadaceae bacterium NML93-0792]PBS15501.1 alpha/beta hydrolase [Xanthomonadaceae bacterium NML93-0793]PBS20355.1 alpha/beta hydrolase [Xanthomonadaceae bacterium NML93-0831]
MRPMRLTLLALAASAALAGCGGGAPATGGADGARPARMFGEIPFHACTLDGGNAATRVEAQCATFEVPENPDAPDGRRIGLNIAWLPAGNSDGGTGDPVVFLAGGPGQAATALATHINGALREVRRQRDIVLIDQRGTGGSNPLDCVDADGAPMELDALTTPTDADLDAWVGRCLAGLEGRADPRFYTTANAIRDLDTVRAALGAGQLNLIGGSYGTRVAQQYAMAYPQHTRSLVLDGVAPNDLVVGGEFARTFENALALQAQQCAQDAACRARFPTDLQAQLRAVLATLRSAPAPVVYRDPTTGAQRDGMVTPDTVSGLAFLFSYAPQTASLLPLMLDEASQGRYAPLMALSQLMNQNVGGQMTRGMQWSVICAEDAARYREDAGAADTVLGPELAQLFFGACRTWPAGAPPANHTAALQSDVPALLLSGALDPVTPPAYAERVLAGLPNGRHLVLAGQGHGTLALGCMPKLLAQFVESTDAAALDATCLDAMRPVAPFTSFNGWEP